MARKCNYVFRNTGTISELHNAIYGYLFSDNNINSAEVERILLSKKLFTNYRGKDGKLHTTLTMGQDVLNQKRLVSGINQRVRTTLGENIPDLILTKFVKRVTSSFNPNGNDLYAVSINPEAIKQINSIKDEFSAYRLEQFNSIDVNSMEEYYGFDKRKHESNEDIAPIDQLNSPFDLESPLVTEKKIALIKSLLDVNVVMDDTVDNAQVDPNPDNQTPTIRLNPNRIFRDTVIHEFGHIYIDLLGGVNNAFIIDGIEELRDSDVWKYVKNNYPHLKEDSEHFEKEVLTTAIGREAVKLEDMSNWRKWLDTFFSKIKAILGIDRNVAKKLAREILSSKIQSDLSGKLSSYSQEQRFKINKNAVIEHAKDALFKKISIFKNYVDKAKDEIDRERRQESVNKLENLLKEISEKEVDIALLNIVQNADSVLSSVEARMKEILDSEDPIELKEIQLLNNYIKAYDGIIQDTLSIYNSDEDFKKVIDSNDFNFKLNGLTGRMSDINSNYKKLRNEYLKEKLNPGRIDGYYRTKFSNEFKDANPKSKSESLVNYNKRKDAYVNQRMADSKDEIERENKIYLDEIFKKAAADIEGTDLWIVDPRSLNDDLIQYAVEMLDSADYKSRISFYDTVESANKIFKELSDLKGSMGIVSSDTIKFYDEMIEDEIDEDGNKTGNKTNNYVGKYYSKYYQIKKELASKVDWNRVRNKDFSQKEWIEFRDWSKANTNKLEDSETGEVYYAPKSKWINPQFTKLEELRENNSPIAKAYDYLIDLNKQKDYKLPQRSRLYLRLPGITKGFFERMGTTGFKDGLKDSIGDIFKRRPDDQDWGVEVLTSEGGKERHAIPIFFRKKVELKDQSFDLFSMAVLDHNMATNFQNKLLISADLEAIKDIAGEREYVSRKGHVAKIEALFKKEGKVKEVTTPGIASNTYKAMESLVETRLYGIRSLSSVKQDKIANQLIKWSGGVALALNFYSPIVNTIQGKLMNWLESSNNGFFNRANLRHAETLYFKDSLTSIPDYFKRTNNSKTHKLANKFALAEKNPLERLFNENVLQDKVNLHTLSQAQDTSEHWISHTMMYAILDNILVMDANGNYLTATGITDDPEKALKLHEAYVLNNGHLELDSRVKATNLGQWNEDSEFEISRRIQKVLRDLHGNYSKDNLALAQRYAAGRLAFFLRKWMVPGYKKRMRGISKSLVSKDSIDPKLEFYSLESGEFEEGYYTSTIRFFKEMMGLLKEHRQKALSIQWDKASDSEKRNVIKTTKEFAIIVGALLASKMFASLAEGADDEDEKNNLYFLAYLTRRTYSEFSFYVNPAETLKIIKSPSATVTTLTDMLDVMSYLIPISWFDGSFTERYSKGKRKGKLKFVKEIEDLIPVIKQFDKNAKDSYSWLIQ